MAEGVAPCGLWFVVCGLRFAIRGLEAADFAFTARWGRPSENVPRQGSATCMNITPIKIPMKSPL